MAMRVSHGVIFTLLAGLICMVNGATESDSDDPPTTATRLMTCDTKPTGDRGPTTYYNERMCWMNSSSIFILTSYYHGKGFIFSEVNFKDSKCTKRYERARGSLSTYNPNYCFKGKAYLDSNWYANDEQILIYNKKGALVDEWQPVTEEEGNVWHVAVNDKFLVISFQNFSSDHRYWLNVYSNDDERTFLFRFKNVEDKYHEVMYLSEGDYLWTAVDNSYHLTVYNINNGSHQTIPVYGRYITGAGNFVYVANGIKKTIEVYDESGQYRHDLAVDQPVRNPGYLDVYPPTGKPDRLVIQDRGSYRGVYYNIYALD